MAEKKPFQGFPRISPLTNNDFVGKELSDRKSKSYGSQKNARPRTTWIRAFSNAIPTTITAKTELKTSAEIFGPGGDDEVSKITYEQNDRPEEVYGNQNIMVGGLLTKNNNERGSFDMIYKRPGRNGVIRDRPMPGIESISIVSKGEMQSLRKLTINWFCPSIEDLDELAPYWLSPGISIIVEWGWGRPGQTIFKLNIEDEKKMSNYYSNPKLVYEELITHSRGNQDFYMGIITNFTWNMNSDGTFSCTTELTSLGHTLLNVDLNREKVYRKGATPEEKTNTMKQFIEDNLSEGVLRHLTIPQGDRAPKDIDPPKNLWKNSNDMFIIDRQSTFSVPASLTGAGLIGSAVSLITAALPNSVYVSWRFIEEQIVNEHAQLLYGDDETSLFKLDSSYIEISNDKFLYTTDADILLIIRDGITGKLNFDANSNSTAGFIRNLYVNMDFVIKTFKESETLGEFLNTLLRGMSKSAGDIWNFKVQPSPINESQLQVIDLNYTSGDDLEKLKITLTNKGVNGVLSFGGYSGDSILTDVSFTSKLTDQLALKYFAGRNMDVSQRNLMLNDNNDAGVRTIFEGYTDRILKNVKPPKNDPLTDDEIRAIEDQNREKDELEKDKRDSWSVSTKTYKTAVKNNTKLILVPGWEKRIIILDEDAKETMVEHLNRKPDPDTNDNIEKYTPIYPLEISVTIDGISGILPGHCFVLNNLPKMYRNNGVFQVVEVGHEVTADWKTTLRCFYRVIRIGGN